MLKRQTTSDVTYDNNTDSETIMLFDCVNTDIQRAEEVSPIQSVATTGIWSSAGLKREESCLISLDTFADTSTSSSETISSDFSNISLEATRMPLHDGGNLPLHFAVSNFAMEVMADPDQRCTLEQRIRDMALASPESVNTFNHAGMTPFHLACKEGASYQIIFDLFTIWPHAVSTCTQPLNRPVNRRKSLKRPMLPLHIACRYSSGLTATQKQVISFLLRVYPEAALISTSEISVSPPFQNGNISHDKRENNPGDLPLHLYCENHFCNLAVLEILFKAYPAALQQRNRHGRLPIHLACERRYFQRLEKGKNTKSSQSSSLVEGGSSDDVIRYLVKVYPESLQICDDKKGESPLQAAVRGYQDSSTITYMLKACPQSIRFVDLWGRTALHQCVIRTIIDPDVMAILLERDRYATCIKDHHDQGNIPLQYVAASKSLDLIYTLIRSCPLSLEILRNPNSNK